MSAPLNLIRALLVAAVCAAMLATCATAASAQVAPPAGGGDVVAPDPGPAPEPPAPDPVPIPEPPVNPAPPEPPADPAPQPPADPVQPDPPADPAPPGERRTDASTPQRDDTARTSNPAPAAQSSVPAGSSAQFAPPAPLPGGGAGEDWAWTDQGDAFIVGTGGSRASGTHGALAHFTGAGSIATAARVPALGSRERAGRDAAQAYANGSALTVSDAGSGTGLFAGLFGGGGGGAGGVLLLTVFAILAVFRMLHPDWNRAFRMSTVIWRPSAYPPPIEHPG